MDVRIAQTLTVTVRAGHVTLYVNGRYETFDLSRRTVRVAR